ncbi:MAG: DUF1343 domain-containing protein [Myxococcota bacterium]|nr:DUF1343 domain-containing protein [Myxococcota bacterium]
MMLMLALSACSCAPSPEACEPCERGALQGEAAREQSARDAVDVEAELEEAEGLSEAEPVAAPAPLRLGVEVLLEERIDLLEGKRVGLLTNASGVDRQGRSTLERFAEDERFDLVQLYAPEHGLRGTAPAGASLEDELDPRTGVPVEALYGQRSAPSAQTLAGLDVLVFDIQDVGSRTYTYITTLGKAMQAAAKAGVVVVVLDRPNPLGGELIEGPIREARYQSFVGWAPIPVVHGMTIGELARFYNGEMALGTKLEVVPMQGWRRSMRWDDTGLDWRPTSPNIPHARNALLYVATGMVAGVSKNVNEGCGYTMPFETIAADFIDAADFAQFLRQRQIPGVRFLPIAYRPFSGAFRKKDLSGVQLFPEEGMRPLHTALQLLVSIERLYPGVFEPTSRKHFGRIWGNDKVLEMIRDGAEVEAIEASWQAELEGFAARRAAYLLYE